MRRPMAVALLLLVLAFPILAAAQSPASGTPQAIVSGNELAEFYPMAFANALGLDSTLVLTSLEGGNFEIVAQGPDGQTRNFPMQIPPGTVRQIGMQEIGIADGVGLILVRAADAQTTGVSALVVQTQAGGVDIVDPFSFPPTFLD